MKIAQTAPALYSNYVPGLVVSWVLPVWRSASEYIQILYVFHHFLIRSCQMIFKSFANSCCHLRSLGPQWQEKPEDWYIISCLWKPRNLRRKKTISTPLRMEKPVRRPIVPPIKPNWASSVTFKKFTHQENMCFQRDLLILLNLIIGCCVNVDVHCLEWVVVQHWNWKKDVTWCLFS